MPVIEAREIVKQYGERTVLAGLSLRLKQGEGLCLFGPSGCGKTTLLRILAGLEVPDSGEVVIHGRVVSGPRALVPPRRRHLNMVFQDLALWPHMRVGTHLDFVMKAMRIPRAERRNRIEELLNICELHGVRRAYPDGLSGGEGQRLAIARALATEPEILLLDEPFANLDARLRKRITSEIMRRRNHEGMGIVIASHRLDETEGLVDFVLHMERKDRSAPEAGSVSL